MALDFDPESYRQRLNLALSLPDSSGGNGAAPSQGDSNAGELPDAALPDQADAQQPRNLRLADNSGGGSATSDDGSDGAQDEDQEEDPPSGQAASGPGRDDSPDTHTPFKHNQVARTDMPPPKFDTSKLKGAQSIADITSALPKKQLNRYMDWWQTQYGNINEKYDQMQAKVGAPQDEDRPLSRKEKFDALMSFGLHLMRASQPDQHGGKGGGDFVGAFGQAAEQTMSGQLAQRHQETVQNQEQHQAIEQQRQSDLRSIGNQGQAMVTSSKLALTDAQTRKAIDEADNLETPEKDDVKEVVQTDKGALAIFKKGGSKLMKDASGQPYKITGTIGGTSKDQRTANEKNIDDLVKRGLPQDLATSLVYKQIRDPRAAWQQIYRAHITKDATPQEAKAEADNVISELYGENAIKQAKSGLGMGGGNDPLGILGSK